LSSDLPLGASSFFSSFLPSPPSAGAAGAAATATGAAFIVSSILTSA